MPNIKQGGGYSLTFSKKNKDVKDHLDELKSKGVTITNYICETVRFYEKYKECTPESSSISDKDIENIIKDKVNEILKGYEGNKAIKANKEKSLEDDLDSIEDSDLEED